MPGVSIRSIPLFQGLTQAEADYFAAAAEEVHYQAGELLLAAGNPTDSLYYVVKGEITARVHDTNRMPTMVSVIAPGHMAGWSALVPPHIATASLSALTDLHAVRFDGQRMRELCEANPRLGLVVMRNLGTVISERLAATTARLADAMEHIHGPSADEAVD